MFQVPAWVAVAFGHGVIEKLLWELVHPVEIKVLNRDKQILPTTSFSLVLRKEYFDCPQRDSRAVHYI